MISRYLIAILLVLFATNLDIFINKAGVFPLKPSQFLIPLFFGLCIISNKIEDYSNFIKTHSFRFFLTLFILSLIYSVNALSSNEEIINKIVYSLIALLFYLFTAIFFYKNDGKLVSLIVVSSIIILGLSIWYDNLVGLPQIKLRLRKGGFADNPNAAASALKFLALCAFLFIRKGIVRVSLLLFIVATIFVTFSRSGFIALILLSILLLLNQWKAKFNFRGQSVFVASIKAFAVLSVSYIILLNIADYIQREIPAFQEGKANSRINLLLGKDDRIRMLSAEDESQFGRKNVAISYFNMFVDNPFGHGTAYTTDTKLVKLNTHNYFLSLAIDYGILGLLAFLAFLFFGLKKSIQSNNFYYFILILLLIFEGFVSNTMLSERAIIIVIALMDSKLYNMLDSKREILS